jgi:predicted ArsR family transcriptional regulator
MTPGQSKQITDEQILQEIKTHPDKAVTAPELADELDLSSTGILNRLDDLNDEGMVRKKKVGGRAVVWWLR